MDPFQHFFIAFCNAGYIGIQVLAAVIIGPLMLMGFKQENHALVKKIFACLLVSDFALFLLERLAPANIVFATIALVPILVFCAAWIAFALWVPMFANRVDHALSNVENMDRKD